MTATNAPRGITKRIGESPLPELQNYPMKAGAKIQHGTIVALQGGYAVAASTALGLAAVGVANISGGTLDNTSGANGDLNVQVRPGVHGPFANADGIAQADVGGDCFLVDNQTVAKSDGPGTRSYAGKVYAVDASGVYVQIVNTSAVPSAASLTSALASNANGQGASLVGIEDSAAIITATTVEGALAELAKYEPVALADPGTAQAIPVTRSAYVGMTIGAGAETNTLAIPTFVGQRMVLNADTVGAGTRAITSAQAINQAGNTVMTFAQARDCISLVAIKVGGALRWTVTANDGVALS